MVSLKLPALVLAFMTTMVASKPFNPNGPGVVKDKQCTIVKPDNDYVVKDGGFKQTGFSFQGNSNAAFTSYIDGDEDTEVRFFSVKGAWVRKSGDKTAKQTMMLKSGSKTVYIQTSPKEKCTVPGTEQWKSLDGVSYYHLKQYD